MTGTAPKAMVIGCAGQDGSYLTDLLVSKAIGCWASPRPSSDASVSNLSAVLDRVDVVRADLADTPQYRRTARVLHP